ncbi:Rossmann-fold NAD(P)-binding domain-containing protein [Craterilacuibacter sinensis]|uniref:Epimerase n=1 Tax=Craterilacuibacter sinensis TaxID=2686017 RepID=A0A845BKD4_9NEIS|nr:epimerase [Craterilacuibacter sinensis]MXR35850.1 epimerase [Craterilacuibacter sinensis]
MKVLIFGATGMVGGGVLRECLLAADVERVVSIGRSALLLDHPKLVQVVRPNFATDTSEITDDDLRNVDACFFCLGVSASGLSEEKYTALTYSLTMAVAERLSSISPQASFVYVSGARADSSEQGSSMWARVRGKTENALLRLPFKHAYVLRPAVIQPLNNAVSKTDSYRIFYKVLSPLLTFGRKLFPSHVLTTEVIGQAMLQIARRGAPVSVLNAAAIYEVAYSSVEANSKR